MYFNLSLAYKDQNIWFYNFIFTPDLYDYVPAYAIEELTAEEIGQELGGS